VFLVHIALAGCVSGSETNEASGQKQDGATPVELTASTDRTTATITEPITYTLAATFSSAVTVELPEVGAEIAGLRVVDFGEDGPREVDGRMKCTKWYTLRADVAGSYIIPSLPVTYSDKSGTAGKLKTPQIFIRVSTTRGDTGADESADIIDIKALEKPKRDLLPYIVSGTAAVLLIGGIIGIVIYRDRRRRNNSEHARPAHVIALEAIERLNRSGLIKEGAVREHFFSLSDIFRRYIEDRFSVAAVEQTTQELLPVLREMHALSPDIKKQAESFLIGSDLIKFAKHVPSRDEITQEHERVLAVIHATKHEEPDAPAV